jgi:hypothetical protein
MWNLSSFTEWLIQAACTLMALCVMIALFFGDEKKPVKKSVVVPSYNTNNRRQRFNRVPTCEPEEFYIQHVVANPERSPRTEQKLIDDAISSLRGVGFLMKDAKAAVLRVCKDRVFTDCESLLRAALEKPKSK